MAEIDNSITRICHGCGRETNVDGHSFHCIVGNNLDEMGRLITRLEIAKDEALARPESAPSSEFTVFRSMAYEIDKAIMRMKMCKNFYELEHCEVPMKYTWVVDNIPDWIKLRMDGSPPVSLSKEGNEDV